MKVYFHRAIVQRMELLLGAHDPEGRMTQQIELLSSAFELFDRVVTAVTPSSVPEIKSKLKALGVVVLEGGAQLHSTRLTTLNNSYGDVYMTELDKLLHTARFFPEDLEQISRLEPEGMILYGRTEKAFATYPASWRDNERVANYWMAKTTNIADIDIAVSDIVADGVMADLLKRQPALPGCECCVEMPAEVILANLPFTYISSDRYEWEDPDRYSEEIRVEGFENWKSRMYDSPSQWSRREGERQDYLRAISRLRARLGLSLDPEFPLLLNH